MQGNKFHACEIVHESTSREMFKLFFQKENDLRKFQKSVTGYKVGRDLYVHILIEHCVCWCAETNIMTSGRDIPIRIAKRSSLLSLLPSPAEYKGRLQLWEKKPVKGPEETRQGVTKSSLSRANSAMSPQTRTSIASTTVIRTQARLCYSHIADVNSVSAVITEEPVPPLLVLLVESSKNTTAKPGDIIALSS